MRPGLIGIAIGSMPLDQQLYVIREIWASIIDAYGNNKLVSGVNNLGRHVSPGVTGELYFLTVSMWDTDGGLAQSASSDLIIMNDENLTIGRIDARLREIGESIMRCNPQFLSSGL